MRRSADQHQIDDLARRRLDVLLAELGGAPPALSDQHEDGPDRPAGAPDRPPPRGRHAHRPLPPGARLSGWLQDRLPVTLQGRVALGPAQVGVVALLLACGVLWAAWTTGRSGGELSAAPQPVVAPPSATRSEPPAASGTATDTTPLAVAESQAAPATGPELVVDVQGTVRRPGIVVLPDGSRVVDAVKAAGGYTGRRSRLAHLNLARPLVDGEQILVGRAAPVVAVPSALAGAPAPSGPGGLVSLNTADQVTLETLPGVGPVTATAILQWREENGPFTAVDQLLEVSGIGEKTLAEIAPYVTL